jgi:DNA-binding NarL/FixJ family response regulator
MFDHEYSHHSQQSRTLLAEGLSNGEIARRLYISTKTASVHVSNILAKLNMTYRTEVATWAVRSGLVPPA